MKSRSVGSFATGVGLTLLTGFIFATQDSIGKQLMLGMTVLQVIWGRYLVQTAVMASYLTCTTGSKFLRSKYPLLQVMRGGAQLCASLCVYFSLARIPIGDVTALVFCSPIIVTLISGILLKETIGKDRIVAICAGFLGVLLIIEPGSGATSPYHLLVVVGAFMNATYLLLTRKLAGPEEAAATQFNTTAVGAVALTVVVLFTADIAPISAVPFLLLIGIMSAVGHFSLVKAFLYGPASMLSPYLYSQVLFATLYALLWFGDDLRIGMIVGGALLILSGLYIWWCDRLKSTT